MLEAILGTCFGDWNMTSRTNISASIGAKSFNPLLMIALYTVVLCLSKNNYRLKMLKLIPQNSGSTEI